LNRVLVVLFSALMVAGGGCLFFLQVFQVTHTYPVWLLGVSVGLIVIGLVLLWEVSVVSHVGKRSEGSTNWEGPTGGDRRAR
jgi:hypothetical protein